MPIPEIIEQLRKQAQTFTEVADLLDNTEKSVNPAYAPDAVNAGMRRQLIKPRKPHWTQRPENREKIKRWMRKMTRIRMAA